MANRFTASGFDTSGLDAGIATGPGSSTKYYGNTRFMDDYVDSQDQKNAFEIDKRDIDSRRRAYELGAMYRSGSGQAAAKSPSFVGELGKVAAGSAVSAAVTAGFALI